MGKRSCAGYRRARLSAFVGGRAFGPTPARLGRDQTLLDADRPVGDEGGLLASLFCRLIQRPLRAGRFGLSLRLKRLFVEPFQNTLGRLNLVVQIAAGCVVSLGL
jgi:hypothetical protein